jgi:hypothetical protein
VIRSRQPHDNTHASLEISPSSILEGEQIIVRGEGWPAYCKVRIEIDGKEVKPIKIAQGYPVSGGFRPDATGAFVILLSTVSMKSDKHQLIATTARQIPNTVSVKKSFLILERQRLNIDKLRLDDQEGEIEEEGLELPYWRSADFFFHRRFGHIGFVPPGTRETQFHHIQLLRKKRNDKSGQPNRPERRGRGIEDNEPSVPEPGVCNWNPVGAGPAIIKQTPGSPSVAYGGRTLAIAFDPVTPSVMYIGTAVGGLWKSTDGGTTWSPKTDYNISPAIETIAIDHNNHLRIFAGTGEYNNIGAGTYYGNGILRSEDGGNSWTELASSTFERDEISNILFDTTDSTSQHMFLSCSIGVY